jgi:hypothetical protein
LGFAEVRHEAASQETLQIECGIRVQVAQASAPSEESENAQWPAKLRSGKGMRRGDCRIFFQEGFPARVDNPSDACFRPGAVDDCGYGQGVDDIPHRAGFDEEQMLRPLMGIFTHGMATG